jgi:tetratricopeptide (TPR) repeat protein
VLAAELDDPGAGGEVLALLGLVETNAENLARAEELFAEAKEAAKQARSESLAVSALKGEARIAFLRGRPRMAAMLYQRAVRLLDSKPSRQLIESLSGVIVAEAELGRLAEEEIEALAPLSHRFDWDELWIGELRYAFAALLRSDGSFEDVVSLAALVLLISARLAESSRAPGEEEVSQLLASGMMFLSWTREDPSGKRQRGIVGAAERVGGGKEAAEFVEEIFRGAEEQPAIEFPWPQWQAR